MKLESGTKLGPYEIVGVVGAGGMGEVYRARDPRIERDVAIKVLPESFADDPDRLHRFEQEARTAGATNHPNLVTVFDLGEVEGAPYLVMELLEGETLRERIGDARPDEASAGSGSTASGSGRGLSVRRVLEIATQIAQGLAAAHDRQIVHRDLKPENVFITNDGRVKILDFGLAKLSGAASSEQPDAETVQRNTSPGTVLGTVGYMSPEQVRGQAVDHRTDIFAFGAILYEMLTGRRAFFGASGADTMSAILKEDPPELSEILPSIPPGMDRIVRHCLEKSPERRFQSARDLAFDLESIGDSSGISGARHAAEESARVLRRRIGVAAGAIIALAAALATGAWIGARGGSSGNTSQQPSVRASFTQLTFQSGGEVDPSLAPDGKTFIFTSFSDNRRPDIFLQRVDGRTAINLTKTPDQAEGQAVLSHDGSEIAFCVSGTDGGIFVMGATGESRRRVTDFGWNPSWSPDGRFIALAEEPVLSTPEARNADSRLWTVEVTTGTKRQLTKTDAVQPSWSPNGHRIAFWTVSPGGQRDIATLDPAADDPDSTIVMVTDDAPLDWGPAWSSDGRYLYFGSERDGTRNLWRVSIDEVTGKVLGELEPVTLPATMAGHFSVAGDLVAYSSFEKRHSVFRAALDLKRGRFGDAEKIMGGSMLVFSLSASPDAQSIAFSSRATQEDVFLMKADGSEVRQLTNDSAKDRGPSFSADGREIFFYSDREDGVYDIYRIATDGSGVTRITRTNIADDRSPVWFPAQSPDGKWLTASGDHGFGLYDLQGDLPLTEFETPPPYPDETLHCRNQKWSPDGRRLLLGLQHTESGTDRPGVVVYTIESREYELVRETGFPIAWIDDRTILVESDENAVVLDLETRREKEIAMPVDADRVYGLAQDGRTLIFVHTSFDADIWLADLGSSN